MEGGNHLHHHQEMEEGVNKNMCNRQSSSRWTPTSEQIRILKDLYYNNGVRSPTAEQIQRISVKLRQYGKIEGKNVFYWFQNHKARERQKKRFSTHADHHIPMHLNSALTTSCNNNNWQIKNVINHEGHHQYPSPIYTKFTNITNSPAAGNFPMSVGNYASYGSMAMEKSFRECSISPSMNINGGGTGGSMAHNFAWIGVDASYPFLEKRKYMSTSHHHQTLEMENELEDEDDDSQQEIETLELFPVHGQDFNKHQPETDYCFADDAYSPRASLELTLNSYAARFSTSTS